MVFHGIILGWIHDATSVFHGVILGLIHDATSVTFAHGLRFVNFSG